MAGSQGIRHPPEEQASATVPISHREEKRPVHFGLDRFGAFVDGRGRFREGAWTSVRRNQGQPRDVPVGCSPRSDAVHGPNSRPPFRSSFPTNLPGFGARTLVRPRWVGTRSCELKSALRRVSGSWARGSSGRNRWLPTNLLPYRCLPFGAGTVAPYRDSIGLSCVSAGTAGPAGKPAVRDHGQWAVHNEIGGSPLVRKKTDRPLGALGGGSSNTVVPQTPACPAHRINPNAQAESAARLPSAACAGVLDVEIGTEPTRNVFRVRGISPR